MGKAPAKGTRSFLKLRRGSQAGADVPGVNQMPSRMFLQTLYKCKRRFKPRWVKIVLTHWNKTLAEVFLVPCPFSCLCVTSLFCPISHIPTWAGYVPGGVGRQVGKGIGLPVRLGREKWVAHSWCFLARFLTGS